MVRSGERTTLQEVTTQRSRLLNRLARALAIGGAAFSLAPATASARPNRVPAQEQSSSTTQDWGTVTLAGGAVALLVVGALGVGAADDPRPPSTDAG
jgi:hypothetical protein